MMLPTAQIGGMLLSRCQRLVGCFSASRPCLVTQLSAQALGHEPRSYSAGHPASLPSPALLAALRAVVRRLMMK